MSDYHAPVEPLSIERFAQGVAVLHLRTGAGESIRLTLETAGVVRLMTMASELVNQDVGQTFIELGAP
jgi:hypothetical protein